MRVITVVTAIILAAAALEIAITVVHPIAFGEVVQQVSILLGIWVAIYGIDAWRREHKGRRQIELAEEVLALFYEAADAIRWMRHPASFDHEYQDIQQQPDESTEQFRARRNASVVFTRYNQKQDTFNKIRALRYRFMAQIGKDKAKSFDELHGIVSEITLAARMLASLWGRRRHFESASEFEAHRTRVSKYEAVFWEGLEEDDPINPKIEATIRDLESVCRSVIDGKGFLNKPIGWGRRQGSVEAEKSPA